MKLNYTVNAGKAEQAANLVKMADAQQYVDYVTASLGPNVSIVQLFHGLV